MKICPKCSKEHDKNGKFCSRSCGNSRTWSEEDKRKKSDTIKEGIKEGRISTGNSKGVKHKNPRSAEHSKNISDGIKKHYDDHGRKPELSEKEKRAKNVCTVQAYRQRKYSATPFDADIKLIRKIYEDCPEGYEVDHIVALCNGGPHHQDNLQYLPAMENRRKNRTEKYDRHLVIRWQDVVKDIPS